MKTLYIYIYFYISVLSGKMFENILLDDEKVNILNDVFKKKTGINKNFVTKLNTVGNDFVSTMMEKDND